MKGEVTLTVFKRVTEITDKWKAFLNINAQKRYFSGGLIFFFIEKMTELHTLMNSRKMADYKLLSPCIASQKQVDRSILNRQKEILLTKYVIKLCYAQEAIEDSTLAGVIKRLDI